MKYHKVMIFEEDLIDWYSSSISIPLLTCFAFLYGRNGKAKIRETQKQTIFARLLCSYIWKMQMTQGSFPPALAVVSAKHILGDIRLFCNSILVFHH